MLTDTQQSGLAWMGDAFDNPAPRWPILSLLRMLWIRKFRILTVWLLLSAAVLTVVMRLPATYRSETLIVVDQQKIPEKFVSAAVSVDLQDRLATISQEILSNTRLQRIVESNRLYQQERQRMVMEDVLESMRSDIHVTTEKGWVQDRPGAFRVSYEGRDPATVALVTNQIGNLFVEENLRNRETVATGTSDFMKSQMQEAKKTLEIQERKLSDFKTAYNGELPEQEAAIAQELSRLQLQLQGNQDALNRAAQNKITVQSAVTVAQSTEATLNRLIQAKGNGNSGLTLAAQAREKKSEQVEEELAALRSKYTSRHPDVIALTAELEAVRASEKRAEAAAAGVAKDRDLRTNPVQDAQASAEGVQIAALQHERVEALNAQVAVIDTEMKTRQADQGRILKAIEDVQARLHRIPLREQEMAEVTRDYQTSKANYNALQEKIFAADMATDMEHRQKAERFTVIDPARIPQKPVGRRRPLFAGIGVFGALAISIGIWLFGEMRKNRFQGEWELPEGTIVLGRVPALSVSGKDPARQRIQSPDPQKTEFATAH